MRLYKNLSPIHALSFDLDDTLYANSQVITAAELAMQQRLTQLKPDLAHNDPQYWWQQRKLLAAQDAEIRHDVSRWRLLAVEQGLVAQGLSTCEAGEVAELALGAFLQERTKISVSAEVKQLLATLASRFPLVAITNGNADIQRMGIASYFQFALRAGPDGRMKPYPDLFQHAAKRLELEPGQILHIGDHVRSDVLGALNAGCQAAWLNPANSPQPQTANPPLVLPHLELSDLAQLLLLQRG
ncbi:5-amino-6-(5-phospho-D-ribitylamino)uracil phosphatase YigB [Rheinheimera texasensis]|uniref:5-amino-6-(5-phospho-D-ribitylamino)uracil phosphatase YigB n=1 Tax=Rheinheimera texasensis TaxID=306205 RepID=UPI0032B2182D